MLLYVQQLNRIKFLSKCWRNDQQQLILFTLGNHSLYLNFDTLQGVTLMVGTEAGNFDGLSPGWVEIYNFIKTDLQKI